MTNQNPDTAQIPGALRQIRGYAIFILAIVPLLAIMLMISQFDRLQLLGFLLAEIIHVSLLLAIVRRSKVLFWVSVSVFALLALLDIATLLGGFVSPRTIVRFIIEIWVIVALWKNKGYFSA